MNIDGFGTSQVKLDLIDPANPGDPIEVWCATFLNEEHPDEIVAEVYFEMDSSLDYEIWDLLNCALEAYRRETI